jgi:hypothetical protein
MGRSSLDRGLPASDETCNESRTSCRFCMDLPAATAKITRVSSNWADALKLRLDNRHRASPKRGIRIICCNALQQSRKSHAASKSLEHFSALLKLIYDAPLSISRPSREHRHRCSDRRLLNCLPSRSGEVDVKAAMRAYGTIQLLSCTLILSLRWVIFATSDGTPAPRTSEAVRHEAP